MKSNPGENLYNVKIALLTPSLPSIFTEQFSPNLMMVVNREHANIMKEKLPSQKIMMWEN